jgi:streptogramin lyase
MSRYIPKEIVLNNLEIPEGVSILYSTWTIRDKADNTIVHYTPRDEVNLTSKIFTDVFEIGKKYEVIMSMVRTDGPTIDTRPLEVQVFSGEDTYNLYPMPSVIDTPIITMAYALDNVPSNDIKFTSNDMIVAGNATHDYSDWWLTNDANEVIWDSLKDQINKTEIIVSGVNLKKDRLYTMHCVYRGTNRDSSGTGSITFKPNSFDELEIAGDLNHTYYGYGIDTRLKDLNSDMTLFEYKLLGDEVELFSGSNNTGEIEINSYYNGEFIGPDLGILNGKYYDIIEAPNGMVYCIPYSSNRVMKFNPLTKETTLIGSDLGSSTSKYSYGVLVGNIIYCAPHTPGYILKIDTTTDTTTLIGSDLGATSGKYHHGVLVNNSIYFIPYNAGRVLKLNLLNDTTSLIGTDYSYIVGNKFFNGVVAPNGMIYCAPMNATQVLKIDPATDTTSLIGMDLGATTGKYSNITVASNGMLYAAPTSNTKVLKIDPTTDTTSLIGIDLGSTILKYINSILYMGEIIYSIPLHASKILKIDTTNDSVSLIGESLGTALNKYYDSTLHPSGKIYAMPYFASRILEFNPIDESINFIGPDLGSGKLLYSNLLSNNFLFGSVFSGRKVFNFDLNKYEASKNSFLIESYSEYTLRLRMTTSSSVIGWKDIKFKPKQFKVESDVWDDYNHTYENRVEVMDGKIVNYDKSNYSASFTTPMGKSYQLPNGEVILLRNKTTIGRFSIDEETGVMTHLGDLYLPQITLNKNYNVFNFKIFSTGDVLIGVGYTDYVLYHFKYDPVNNLFRYKTKYSITNGGTNTYSEMHLVDSKVVFTTDGVINGSTQDVYVIDLVKQTLELSIVDVVNGAVKGNLIRLDNDDLIIRGGVKKLNNGELVNSSKLLHVKNANGGVKLIGPDLGSTGYQKYRTIVLANNGMLYVIPYASSRVMKINPITGDITNIGSDLGGAINKYAKGILASNGKIYCIPSTANQVLKIDPDTDTVSLIGPDLGASANKYIESAVIAGNGMIYSAPYNTTITQVLKIDPTTDTVSLVGTSLGAGTNKYVSGVVADNGMIYFTPSDASQVLKLNPNTDTTSLIGISLGSTTGKYYYNVKAPNGMIYSTPVNANQVLKIDPTTDTVSLIGPELGSSTSKYIVGVLASNGMIYAAPGSNTKVLKIDPTTDTVSLIGPDLGLTIAKYYFTVLTNGKLYGIPNYANKVLEIDPSNDSINLIGDDLSIMGVSKYWSGTIDSSGVIYAPPGINSTRFLKIDLSGFTVDTSMDNRINLPAIGISDESVLQATLRNNELVLGNFNQFSLKSSSRDEIRYIGMDLGTTIVDKYVTGILADNGMIYCTPYDAAQILKIDPITGKTTLVGTDYGTAITDKYHGGMKADNGMIYFIPHAVGITKVMKLDPTTDTTSLIGMDLGATGAKFTLPNKASNGMIYAFPYGTNSRYVLKIDPNTDTVSLLSTDFGTTVSKCYSGVVAANGLIYGLPFALTKVSKLNPVDDSVVWIGNDLGASASKYSYGVATPSGMIYCAPYNANYVLKIDTNTDVVTTVGSDLGVLTAKYHDSGILASNGMIYFPPNKATQVLKLNPNNDTTTLIGPDLGAGSKYYGAAYHPNGKIYCIPSNASKVLEIDPDTDTVSLIGPDLGLAASKYVDIIMANNNKLYGIPITGATKVLEIDPDGLDSLTFNLKKLPADKNTMTNTSPFIFKSNGGEDFKFTIYLNNGKRLFLSYSKDKPKMILYK